MYCLNLSYNLSYRLFKINVEVHSGCYSVNYFFFKLIVSLGLHVICGWQPQMLRRDSQAMEMSEQQEEERHSGQSIYTQFCQTWFFKRNSTIGFLCEIPPDFRLDVPYF